jgi:dTDP-L-rhamnose 4-epimerase
VTGAFNVASGTPRTVLDMAQALARSFDGAPEPQVTGQWRGGDVRHVFASADLAAERLGFASREGFEAGMREFASTPLRA